MIIEYPNKVQHFEGIQGEYDDFSVFLAGTIDDGQSANWQRELINKTYSELPDNMIVFNPRRDNWNKNADVYTLREQINWEQEHLLNSSIIVMVLLDDSKSPVSLMELGEFCDSQKIVVFCTENFYRFENVKDLCERFEIPLFETNDINEIADKVFEIIKFNQFESLCY
jgi:hypothetical protein